MSNPYPVDSTTRTCCGGIGRHTPDCDGADAWQAPHITPGSQIAVERDGVLHRETVQSVRWQSGEPAVWPDLSWWQRVKRSLTPRRWRKPLKPIRPATLPSMEISTGPVDDDVREQYERTLAVLGKTGTIIDGLIRVEPK